MFNIQLQFVFPLNNAYCMAYSKFVLVQKQLK